MTDTMDRVAGQSDATRKLWPKTLVEMIDVCSSTLSRNGFEEQSKEIALRIVVELCQLFGGKVTYMPRGDRIKNLIRELDVFDAMGRGRTVAEVAADFGLTVTSVYRIRERVLQRRKEERKP